MSHGHTHHDHDHSHSHASHVRSFGRTFAIATALNVFIVIVQAGYGFAAGSMALLSDAAHNFSDVLGLLIAWAAHALAQRAPAGRYTYGYRSATILAVLANGILLLVATGGIVWEAAERIAAPVAVGGETVVAVAAAGIAVNGLSAWLLMSGQRDDLNIRGAFLHMVADAAVSVGVVIAGVIIIFTGWIVVDPLISLVIAAVIVWSTWGLMRDSLALALDAVPRHIDLARVRTYLCALPDVKEVHDLHVWPMSTTDAALTCHLVMPGGHPGDAFLKEIAHHLRHEFGISHPTIQIEMADAGDCALTECCIAGETA